MHRRALAIIGVLVWAAAFPSYAGTGSTPTAFTGSCMLAGTVRFTPALTVDVRPGRATATATGTCTGTLTTASGQRQLNGAAAHYEASESGPLMSCTLGIDSGGGRLVIGGVTLPLRISEKRVAAAAVAQLTGRGWSGLLEAAASPQTNPATVAQECAGAGLRAAAVQGGIQATAEKTR